MTVRRWAVGLVVVALAACGGSDDAGSTDSSGPSGSVASEGPDVPGFVTDVRRGIAAVEAELGEPQEYFEVTSTDRITNVFVAVDDGTAAIAFLYRDGVLEPPAPKQTGASGQTFVAGDVRFDESQILSAVSTELPDTTIAGLSVYGDGVGATYVLAASSDAGGFLDIVVTEVGAIVSVDPI